jgi:hypothetical protein
MNRRRKHLYHLVNRSSRAFIISICAFFIMSGFVFCFMDLEPLFFKGDLSLIGFLILLKNVKK